MLAASIALSFLTTLKQTRRAVACYAGSELATYPVQQQLLTAHFLEVSRSG